jgi:hypothetical protein
MPLQSVHSSVLKDVHAKYSLKGLTFCSYWNGYAVCDWTECTLLSVSREHWQRGFVQVELGYPHSTHRLDMVHWSMRVECQLNIRKEERFVLFCFV